MASSKGTFLKNSVVLFGFLAIGIVATVVHFENLSNIFSMLSAYAAGGVLLFTYYQSSRTKVSLCLFYFSLACFAWGLADTIWAAMYMLGSNPEESALVWIIYTLTNCFLLVSLFVFVSNQFRKWDFIQTIIDVVVNALLSLTLFWLLFFHRDISSLIAFIRFDFTGVLSILTDILIDISIYSLLSSVRTGKIPVFIRMIVFGLLIFTYNDIIYYYMAFNGLYYPNSVIDIVYMFSLVCIAFGALWNVYRKSPISETSTLKNTGSQRKWGYLLIYPVFVTLFASLELVPVKLRISDYLQWTVTIFLYWASCKYVQISIEKEALLKYSNEKLEQRVAEQVDRLTILANQDTLTMLFNRRYFVECLSSTLEGRENSSTVILLIIDVDRFKTVNDTFGHDTGDKVLIDISHRLIEWNRYGATIARLGGDEFAVLVSGKYTRKDAESIVEEIINICAKPFLIDNNSLNLSVSIGIAICSENRCEEKTLMQNADIALYSAKSQGYNKYQIYDPFMSRDYKKTVEIEMLLKQADTDRDFELYFQPQYSLPDRKLIGAEALIRWRNMQHGYIPPDVFIPIAEQIDQIFKIGKWVMHEAINQSIRWNGIYGFPLKIGFNISPKQFKDKNFIHIIRALIMDSGVEAAWIDAEITEGIMMYNDSHINDAFAVLRDLGVTVSIDDFGSGYSALGYLNKYPFDRIKIDKSLIDNMRSYNIGGTNVVRAAINMAHASGIKVLAEGVETNEQLEVLVELGCDQVQGYLLGRPVPADIFEQRFIKSNRLETNQDWQQP